MSQMQTSPSWPPLARRLPLKGLNCRPFTAPLCFLSGQMSAESASLSDETKWLGLNRFTLPSTRPPAMTPRGYSDSAPGREPQTSLWNLSWDSASVPVFCKTLHWPPAEVGSSEKSSTVAVEEKLMSKAPAIVPALRYPIPDEPTAMPRATA